MKPTKQRDPRFVGALALAISLAVTLVIFSDVYRKPFESDKQTISAVFERAPQLYGGDQVRLEGDISGSVKEVKPGPEPGQAEAVLEIDKAAGDIYANASADMKALTLLGGKYYVDVKRGTKNAGKIGSDPIPVERTHVQVELEDFTDSFRDEALTGFQALPGEMAKAFGDPDAPAGAAREFNAAADDISDATEAAQGLRPGYSLPNLIRSTASTVEALDNSGNDDLRRLVAGAAATLQVTANRDTEIQNAIEVTPSLASNIQTTLPRLERTADIFNETTRKLTASTKTLAPTLAGVRPALEEFEVIIPKLPRLFSDVGSLLTGLEEIPRVRALLEDLTPSLRKLDKTVLPYLNKPDEGTNVPTTTAIGGAASGLAGIAALQDENGRYVRFPALAGTSFAYLPCSTNIIDANADATLACDSLDKAIQSYLGYLPGGLPEASQSGRKGGSK